MSTDGAIGANGHEIFSFQRALGWLTAVLVGANGEACFNVSSTLSCFLRSPGLAALLRALQLSSRHTPRVFDSTSGAPPMLRTLAVSGVASLSAVICQLFFHLILICSMVRFFSAWSAAVQGSRARSEEARSRGGSKGGRGKSLDDTQSTAGQYRLMVKRHKCKRTEKLMVRSCAEALPYGVLT